MSQDLCLAQLELLRLRRRKCDEYGIKDQRYFAEERFFQIIIAREKKRWAQKDGTRSCSIVHVKMLMLRSLSKAAAPAAASMAGQAQQDPSAQGRVQGCWSQSLSLSLQSWQARNA